MDKTSWNLYNKLRKDKDKEDTLLLRALEIRNPEGAKQYKETLDMSGYIMESVLANLHLLNYETRLEPHQRFDTSKIELAVLGNLLIEQGHILIEFAYTCLPESPYRTKLIELIILAIVEMDMLSDAMLANVFNRLDPAISSALQDAYSINLNTEEGYRPARMDAFTRPILNKLGMKFNFGTYRTEIREALVAHLSHKVVSDVEFLTITEDEYIKAGRSITQDPLTSSIFSK